MEKRKKGFTLIELVVVIAIIGALAAILVPVMMGYVRKSRVAAANDNAKQNYNTALEVVTACSAEFNGYVVDSRKSVTARKNDLQVGRLFRSGVPKLLPGNDRSFADGR